MEMTPLEKIEMRDVIEMRLTLARICVELHLVFRAQQACLVALNAKDIAEKLGDEMEQLHEERRQQREAEVLARIASTERDFDTPPPESG